RLRHYLGERLEGGHPRLDVAARHHGLTPRTFQRRLAGLGLEYRTLADQVRRDHAIALLTSSSASISAMARALGYENPGAFHRAFRRWTGQTPARFRDAAVTLTAPSRRTSPRLHQGTCNGTRASWC